MRKHSDITQANNLQVSSAKDEQKLFQAVDSLPNEMTPSRDLWAGIEQAVAKTPQDKPINVTTGSKVAMFSKIAAAVLPVALVAGLLLQNGNQSKGSLDAEAPWLAPTIASYEIQKNQLLRQVSHQQTVSKNYDATMKDLEDAERALKTALKNQPGDPALMKMLNAVYQQQLDLIANSHQPSYTQI